MGIIKWLADMQAHGQKGSKRFIFLALFSLVGVVAFSALSGNPVDPNSITSLIQTIVESFIAFLLAHGSYTMFWNDEAPKNEPVVDLLAE